MKLFWKIIFALNAGLLALELVVLSGQSPSALSVVQMLSSAAVCYGLYGYSFGLLPAGRVGRWLVFSGVVTTWLLLVVGFTLFVGGAGLLAMLGASSLGIPLTSPYGLWILAVGIFEGLSAVGAWYFARDSRLAVH